jgi:hypothetical protein
MFCRTTVSEEPDEGDKLKNTNNDEDKKQRIDRMWASFKEGTDTKEAKETVAPIVTKPTKSTACKNLLEKKLSNFFIRLCISSDWALYLDHTLFV